MIPIELSMCSWVKWHFRFNTYFPSFHCRFHVQTSSSTIYEINDLHDECWRVSHYSWILITTSSRKAQPDTETSSPLVDWHVHFTLTFLHTPHDTIAGREMQCSVCSTYTPWWCTDIFRRPWHLTAWVFPTPFQAPHYRHWFLLLDANGPYNKDL